MGEAITASPRSLRALARAYSSLMNRTLLVAFGALAACASEPTGERNRGDATFVYDGDSAPLIVGSAIEAADDPSMMIVQLGTDRVDCEFDLGRVSSMPGMPDGYFVSFALPKTGVIDAPYVHVQRGDGSESWHRFATGIVGLDSVGERVTGTVSFSLQPFESVREIEVLGRFDVKRCF